MRELLDAQRPLAESLMLGPGDTFGARSRSKPGVIYWMLVGPDGSIMHLDEGCEGERFRGPGTCHHSTDSERFIMTTSLQRYEAQMSPVAIDFSEEQLAVLKDTIAKGASDTELQLFVATCKRTGLDPFLKQVYAIQRRSKEGNEWVTRMTIQVGVDGLRLIADRTGRYAGMNAIEWLDEDGVWGEVWTGVGDHPLAARTAVYRKDFSRPVPAVCRWDSYVQTTNTGEPTSMWRRMPDVMLGKCVESLALRRAFPAEMSGIAAAIDSEYDPEADVGDLGHVTALGQDVLDGKVMPPVDESEVYEDAGSGEGVPAPEWEDKRVAFVTEQVERAQEAQVAPEDNAAQEPAPEEDNAAQEADNAAPEPVAEESPTVAYARAAAAAGPPMATSEAEALSDLLNAIEARHGKPAKIQAIAVQSYLYGTAVVTRLSPEERADYADKLHVRLNSPDHAHEMAYTPRGGACCSLCGCVLTDDGDEGSGLRRGR